MSGPNPLRRRLQPVAGQFTPRVMWMLCHDECGDGGWLDGEKQIKKNPAGFGSGRGSEKGISMLISIL
jgi:hypothetical protein